MLSKDEIKKFCHETWFPKLKIGHTATQPEEFDKHLNELMKLYTKNIEVSDFDNRQNIGREISKGYEEVQQYYKYMISTYPKIAFTIIDLFPTEKGFILWYEGSNAGFVNYFQGMTIVELVQADDGLKIAKLVEFYNILPFIRQDT